jgi:UDP-N-acetylglucosamine diphosphorylase/glucosamine-1-phosphate N-acetyltransferase
MRIIIYEDNYEKFYPIINLFPHYHLRVGVGTIAENTALCFGKTKLDFVARPMFNIAPVRPHEPTLYLSSRLLLTARFRMPRVDSRIVVNGQTVGFAKNKPPFPGSLGEIKETVETIVGSMPVKGMVMNELWEIITLNTSLLVHQCSLRRGRTMKSRVAYARGKNIYTARDAQIHRMVFLDAADGPIYIDAGAQIRPFSSIIGPSYIGKGSIVDRAKITRSSIGPHCRIGGEVEESIFQGFSNKYHEGFIGHSYVGEWVNLGALTTNSDLKNNYGPVRIKIGKSEINTGVIKLGCFVGDHAKLGIGTLIPTGAVMGSFVNFAGGGMMPRYVPDFKWVIGNEQDTYDLEKAIKTAQTVLGRRNVQMSHQYEQLIRILHGQICRSN